MTDRSLLDDLRAGSQDAFNSIFRAHYASLVALAESMLRDRAAAEEVVQEVMLELWRRRERLVVASSLRGYLFRATRNRTLNYIRDRRVALRLEPIAAAEATGSDPADRDLVESEIADAVRRAVAQLPDRCREVFELSRVHGLRYAEIADAMNISIKTVEAQMGKALKILRVRLAEWL